MTRTEKKAKEKAVSLSIKFSNKTDVIKPNNRSIEMAIKCCDEVIETLNSIKGMGKIHKVNFWKLVKKYLND